MDKGGRSWGKEREEESMHGNTPGDALSKRKDEGWGGSDREKEKQMLSLKDPHAENESVSCFGRSCDFGLEDEGE